MSTAEAQAIVIDVALKRRNHTRQALREAVSVLEVPVAVKTPVKTTTRAAKGA
jgi:hypothetical protein